MVNSGTSLSLFGRSAISSAGGGRASRRDAPERVEPTDPLKDPRSGEYRELQELKARDREVRQHEQAHVAAGGQYTRGGPIYSYRLGPDGRQYAIGGEVDIDTAPIADDPAATIRKMKLLRRAALAPAEPSVQDRAVAAEVARKEAEARVELREAKQALREVASGDGKRADSAVPAQAAQRAGPAIDAYRLAAQSGDSARPLLDLTA